MEDRSQPPRLETIGLVESHGSDLIKSRPTQTALRQEIKVEDRCRSTWLNQVLEKHRCHFVGMVGSTSDATPMETVEEFILDALDFGFDDMVEDSSPIDEQEYQAMLKEYEAELTTEEATAPNIEGSGENSLIALRRLT